MSAVATAIVGGAVIGGVASNMAAGKQASAQESAANDQVQMFNTINGQEQPFIQQGYGASSALNQLLGLTPGSFGGLPNGYLNQTMGPFSFDPSSITNSPGYQFAQKQGLSAVANNQAPLYGAMSGPALKALTNFSTGTAAQYYNDYFNQAQSQYTTNLNSQLAQQQNIFSRLSGIAGLGQNAASQVGTAGTQLGTGAAQAVAGAGASQAAGIVGAGNAASSAANTGGSYLMLNNLLSQGGGGSNGGSYGVPGWTPAQGGT